MPEQYIMLPGRTLRAPRSNYEMMSLITRFGSARSTAPPLVFEMPEVPPLTVIDSINEDGPKLVEADQATARLLRRSGLRLEPVITYRATAQKRFDPNPPPSASQYPAIDIAVVSGRSGNPVPGAVVTAFTNFGSKQGAEEVTDANGRCSLYLGSVPLTLDRLYVYPPMVGFWGSYQISVSCGGNLQITLEPLDPSYIDALAHFYGSASSTEGNGIRVGVVDTGIDNSHPDLQHVKSGRNTAQGEAVTAWQDNGTGHGTHVAGVIGARNWMRNGLAPAA